MSGLNIEFLVVGPIQTNCYIIWDDKDTACWIIDPGGLARSIIAKIEELKLTPEKLIITHSHWDHFLGAKGLKRKFPNMQVVIHRDDSAILPDPEKNGSILFLGKSIVAPQADVKLNGDEVLQIGDYKFKVFHTPGHTPGSICLYCEEERVIFVGDLIFAEGGIGRTDLPRGSYEKITNSIHRILTQLPEETIIYPGHGPATIVGRERTIHGL